MPHTRSRTRCSLCSCMGLLPSRFSVYLRGSATPTRDQGPDTIADIEFRSRSSHWHAKCVYTTERAGAIGMHPVGFTSRFGSCCMGARTGTPGPSPRGGCAAISGEADWGWIRCPWVSSSCEDSSTSTGSRRAPRLVRERRSVRLACAWWLFNSAHHARGGCATRAHVACLAVP
jgi:hypothetical protein